MKSLRAFWHWVDNEKPTVELYATKAIEKLSPTARLAIETAEKLVAHRTGGMGWGNRVTDADVIGLRPATRDLSLAVCAALDAMHAQVEENCLAPEDIRTQPIFTPQALTALQDWLPAMPRVCDDDGLKRLRSAGHEYEPLWPKLYTAQQFAAMNQQHALDMQRAAQLTGFEQLDRRPPHHRGKTSSVYDEATRTLDIYPATCVEALERIRGLLPKTIVVHGKPEQYEPDALVYLPQVVRPMFEAGGSGAQLSTFDADLDAFGL
jgi:hypothetical protein